VEVPAQTGSVRLRPPAPTEGGAMRQRSIGTSLAWGAAGTLLLAALSGCSLGMLLSKPWIRNANNNDVVFFGDSIFALSGEIQRVLHGYAGGTFRNYTTSGAELIGGSIAPSVVEQIATANADNPNSTVYVMDGGGNDILIPAIAFDPYDCMTQWYEFGRLSSTCKSFIDEIYVDGVDLLNDLAADGVSQVIYLGYYYTKNGLILADDLEEAIVYGDAKLSLACQNSVVSCTFLDPRSKIRDSDITADGVHPNATGSKKLADLIWPVLRTQL
jgi:lysophospholipase L1-like esterase